MPKPPPPDPNPPSPSPWAFDADTQPTPTQSEVDRAATGEHVIEKEWDGSPIDESSADPTPPLGGPGVPEPEITSHAPSSWTLPDVDLIINGNNFTANSVIVFDHVPQPTTNPLPSELRTSITGFAGGPGDYEVLVRSEAGDSNVVTFTFVDLVRGEGRSPIRSKVR
jgi:hypothetical protein